MRKKRTSDIKVALKKNCTGYIGEKTQSDKEGMNGPLNK